MATDIDDPEKECEYGKWTAQRFMECIPKASKLTVMQYMARSGNLASSDEPPFALLPGVVIKQEDAVNMVITYPAQEEYIWHSYTTAFTDYWYFEKPITLEFGMWLNAERITSQIFHGYRVYPFQKWKYPEGNDKQLLETRCWVICMDSGLRRKEMFHTDYHLLKFYDLCTQLSL